MVTRLSLLPIRERPTERIYARGPDVANLSELLSIVLGGSRQIELAELLVIRYKTLNGQKVYYIDHSRTEYVFTKDGGHP